MYVAVCVGACLVVTVQTSVKIVFNQQPQCLAVNLPYNSSFSMLRQLRIALNPKPYTPKPYTLSPTPQT